MRSYVSPLFKQRDHDLLELFAFSSFFNLSVMVLNEVCQMKGAAQAGYTTSNKKYVNFHYISFIFHRSLLP